MIVPNVLVFIHVCHAETTGTGDTKKKEYISIETSLRFKKYLFIFFHILNSTALWSSPLRP